MNNIKSNDTFPKWETNLHISSIYLQPEPHTQEYVEYKVLWNQDSNL